MGRNILDLVFMRGILKIIIILKREREIVIHENRTLDPALGPYLLGNSELSPQTGAIEAVPCEDPADTLISTSKTPGSFDVTTF